MFVASGVEGRAVAAMLPQVIGRIQTAIGCATLTRACGIAVHVMVGDPVCLGDTIETAADGQVGVRFIDGTVFSVSRSARVVLDEFVSDRNGTLRSALLAVTKGAFAFRAGGVASTGLLRIDTPVGSIRGRPHASGFGLLSLAALTFAMVTDARAADPNTALLDDDRITYKDLAHGAFELVTKEAIPRHVIVDDPGETIVLSRRGSSVSVNQFTNSDARMEELHLAQQELLANLTAAGTNGSSTPPSGNLLPVQPINFTDTDAATGQESLPPLLLAPIIVPEIFIKKLPTLAITSIAGQIDLTADNIINAGKANAGVEIRGTTSGVEDGQIVTITIVDGSNNVVFSSKAIVTNSAWLINIGSANAKALADGLYTLTADVSNASGDPANASRVILVDETPPAIAVHTTISHNIVNINAASAGFAIVGTTFDAENGQPVTVKIVDSTGHVVDSFATTLANNTWSVTVSSTEAKLLRDGSYTVTADVSDAAGNPAPQAMLPLTVDETPPTVTWLPLAERGVEGTTIALGAITASVSNVPGFSNSVQSLVVSGIPVGAVLTDGTNNFMATDGNTSIEVKGWNLSSLKIIPSNDTNFTLTITAADQGANTASASELVTVAPPAPDLNPVAAHGHEDTAIALDLGVTVKSLSGSHGDVSPNSLDALVVSDIPVGATLSDGSGLPGHSFTATEGHTSYDVAAWSLPNLKITPPAEFEGCFTLTIAATEHDLEGDISATARATEVVKVAPVADPPTASAPATLTVEEKANCVAVAGVSVGPLAEDNDDTVSATLMVSHGTLHVGWLSGVTVTGDDSTTLTLSGDAAAVNAILAGLTYTPTWEYEGRDVLHLSVTSSDGSNSYPTAATASTAITVNSVADPPTARAPETLALDENDTCVAVAGVRVGPLAEDGDDTVSATLMVSHGTLHVGDLNGVTVTGDDCATLTLSGDAAAVNKLLAGLTYTPTWEYEGCDTLYLSVTSTDGSSTYPRTATASTAITVFDDDDRDGFQHMATPTQVVSDTPAALDGSWAAQATVEQFSFATALDVGTHATGEGATLVQVGLTLESFTFDQTPVRDIAGATTVGDAAVPPPRQIIGDTEITAPGAVAGPSLAEPGSHDASGTSPDYAGHALVAQLLHDLMV